MWSVERMRRALGAMFRKIQPLPSDAPHSVLRRQPCRQTRRVVSRLWVSLARQRNAICSDAGSFLTTVVIFFLLLLATGARQTAPLKFRQTFDSMQDVEAAFTLSSCSNTNRAHSPAHATAPGHPESFQLESTGTRIFVNIPSAAQIAVVDRERRPSSARGG